MESKIGIDAIASGATHIHSHDDYINSLIRPSLSQSRRISDIQVRREKEIDSKYKQAPSEHEAAAMIQKAYRGHRERRQLEGLTLDPSSRWMEVIRELRYRAATLPQSLLERPKLSPDRRPRNSSDVAKANWRRIGYVAEHASAGERRDSNGRPSTPLSDQRDDGQTSMLMDLRYFLEMVDHKHRYGSNLQVFHEQWLRSNSDRNFFHWLDHGEGRDLDLPGCTREKLDRERIRYLSRDQRRDYLVDVNEYGKLCWAKGGDLITTSSSDFKDSMTGIVRRSDDSAIAFADEEVRQQFSADRHLIDALRGTDSMEGLEPVTSNETEISDSAPSPPPSAGRIASPEKKETKGHKRIIASPATILNKLLRATVKPGTWIYVSDTVGRLYVGIKDSGAFQHASFLSGARISSAGTIGIEHGQLTYISPLSGHYRPTTKSLRRFIRNLKEQGVDLSQLRVSHAYEVLLGIEYYGKTKKTFKKLHSEKKEDRVGSPELDQKLHDLGNSMSATDLVEENWKRSRRRTLEKVMEDLRLKQRRAEQK